MGLAVGTRLGPYEIVSPLGSGGMGEVYCARDTRLERNVAVKVLPATIGTDPSLRQRLEREAKAVSKLSHPHICTLHDIGRQSGMDFLVMELLDGETLEQRLKKGPLPPEQTIRYAAQIADALAKAHKQGITHRDLKPSNVMLTKAGAKLMDFGLAKQTGVAPLAEALTEMTAEQSKLTTEGSIVGTFQYMAPEQLEGKEADARTDIFALGELIYEMATGRSAFTGKSRASLIAAILTSDPPPITQLQPMTPPALDRLVRKCLAKDPDERWQNAADLASELGWLAESSVSALIPAATTQKLHERAWKIAVISMGCVAILLGYLYWSETTRTSHAQVMRTFINAPEKMQFNFAGDVAGPVMVSPDGTQLVFSANGSLWLRSLHEFAMRHLEGTQDAIFPFWSPDSRSIGFGAEGKLKILSIGGGSPIPLCDAPHILDIPAFCCQLP